MSNTTVVQSNVPKLEGKQNYCTWNLQILPLLKSRGELAAVKYTPHLKTSKSEKDKQDTTAAMLAEAEHLWKAGIVSLDQQQSDSFGITKATEVPLTLDLIIEDNKDEKSTDLWQYHKNNDATVFMLMSHLADHVLTKVQGIESAKLMYDKLMKLYRTTTELKEFILMEKLFSISYASARNMHKYISQMDDMIKALEHLGIAIDLRITRLLVINWLGAYF